MGNERNKLLSMQFFAVLCISIALVQMQVYAAVTMVGPTKNMCVGVNVGASTLQTKSAMYLALCDGAFSTTRTGADSYDKSIGYLKMGVEKIAFVRDGYLKDTTPLCTTGPFACSAANNVYLMSGSSGGNVYQDTSAAKIAAAADGGGTYAFSSTGAFFGTDTQSANMVASGSNTKSGFYAGTASYMVTTGSISTKMNEFDIAGTKKSACISAIAGGKCGAQRTFNEGTYKFSLFGYSISKNGDIKNVVDKKTGGTAKPFQYIGFRQVVTLTAAPAAATVTVMVTKKSGGAGVDPDQAKEEDIASFKLCVGTTRCLQYVFPSKYNTGLLEAGIAVVDANSATKDIKIKVSWNGAKTGMSLNVDYLMAVADVQANDRWFVYDPDVFDPALSGVSTTTGVGYVALSVCAIAMSIVRLYELSTIDLLVGPTTQ